MTEHTPSHRPQARSDDLPAGLAWSNTLATLSAGSLMASANKQFRALLDARPDDEDLRRRVRSHIQDAHDKLRDLPGGEQMLLALGTPEDLCGPSMTPAPYEYPPPAAADSPGASRVVGRSRRVVLWIPLLMLKVGSAVGARVAASGGASRS
jgi:hypothetical protein